MKLYLIQHGKPETKEVDPDRGLTDEGRVDVERVATFLGGSLLRGGVPIRHSGKTRARQTAEILAAAFPLIEFAESDGLAPLDDPEIWASRIDQAEHDVALVGHLPNLARLTSLLLCGDEERGVVEFSNGGVVCLERGAGGRWALLWSVVPALLELG